MMRANSLMTALALRTGRLISNAARYPPSRRRPECSVKAPQDSIALARELSGRGANTARSTLRNRVAAGMATNIFEARGAPGLRLPVSPPSGAGLLRTHSHDRIDPRRAQRRNPAGNHADRRHRDRHRDEGGCIVRRDAEQEPAHGAAGEEGADHAEPQTDRQQQCSFTQESSAAPDCRRRRARPSSAARTCLMVPPGSGEPGTAWRASPGLWMRSGVAPGS
jgi:hypothetical protein